MMNFNSQKKFEICEYIFPKPVFLQIISVCFDIHHNFKYKGHYVIILIVLTNRIIIRIIIISLNNFCNLPDHCLDRLLEEGFSVLYLAVISRQPQNCYNSSWR